MTAALRIAVCVFAAVVCGTVDGAPTSVTYDQRQQGEYNVHVVMDGVAIVLLPGGDESLAQRTAAVGADSVHQKILFGRHRNGASNNHGLSKTKHKKPATSPAPAAAAAETAAAASAETAASAAVHCATVAASVFTEPAATAAPEEIPSINFNELPASFPATAKYPEIAMLAMSTQQSWGDLKPVSETFNPPDIYNGYAVRKSAAVHADDYDPYSITPSTQDLSVQKVVSPEPEDAAVKTADNTTTLHGPAIAADDASEPTDGDGVSTSPEANPKTPSAVEKPTDGETVRTQVKPADEKTAAVFVVEQPDEAAAEITEKITADEKQTEKIAEHHAGVDGKPAESVEKSAQQDIAGPVKTNDGDDNNGPEEMVAMKTVEKPTFAGALKVTKNPEDPVHAPGDGGTVPVKNPTEMDAVRTAGAEPLKPLSVGFTDAAAGSITSSTKVVEILRGAENAPRKPAEPVETTIVSRRTAAAAAAPTQTEMVAVKTVENPATVTTAKTVSSVKTVIKSGNTKTIIGPSSAGGSTAVLRKVGDRRPLPLVSLEVAPPKFV